MTYTMRWQRHASNTDAEMHRLYTRIGLSRMRIAKIFDCRTSEVSAALARRADWLKWRSARGHAVRYRKPVTLSRVTMEGDT